MAKVEHCSGKLWVRYPCASARGIGGNELARSTNVDPRVVRRVEALPQPLPARSWAVQRGRRGWSPLTGPPHPDASRLRQLDPQPWSPGRWASPKYKSQIDRLHKGIRALRAPVASTMPLQRYLSSTHVGGIAGYPSYPDRNAVRRSTEEPSDRWPTTTSRSGDRQITEPRETSVAQARFAKAYSFPVDHRSLFLWSWTAAAHLPIHEVHRRASTARAGSLLVAVHTGPQLHAALPEALRAERAVLVVVLAGVSFFGSRV